MDSLAREGKYQLEVGLLKNQLSYLESQQPKWYEKPAFVATSTAIIVIIFVLKAVEISVGE